MIYEHDEPLEHSEPRADLHDDWPDAVVQNASVWQVYESGYAQTHHGLKPEVLDWLDENVGPRASMSCIGKWRMTIPITDPVTHFYFEDSNKALMFKLMWG